MLQDCCAGRSGITFIYRRQKIDAEILLYLDLNAPPSPELEIGQMLIIESLGNFIKIHAAFYSEAKHPTFVGIDEMCGPVWRDRNGRVVYAHALPCIVEQRRIYGDVAGAEPSYQQRKNQIQAQPLHAFLIWDCALSLDLMSQSRIE